MSRAGPALLLLATWGAVGLAAVQPAPPAVQVEPLGDVERVDAFLPGNVKALAFRRDADGGRDVVMLVDPTLDPPRAADEEEQAEPEYPPCGSTATRSLWRLSPGGEEPDLELLAEGLSPRALFLDTLDVDGDGDEEILVGRPGALQSLDEENGFRPQTLLEDAEFDRISFWPERPRPPLASRPLLVVPGVGSARFDRAGAEGWMRGPEIDLPVLAAGFGSGIRVISPVPGFFGVLDDGRWAFATLPEQFGAQRLRQRIVRADAESGGVEGAETWARLPEPEQVLRAFNSVVDGRPMLVTLTMPSEKVNVFGEVRVRVHPVKEDRSRAGHPPLVAFESRCNLAQGPSLAARFDDVDGDGRTDLLLSYLRGFDRDRIVLDTYLGEESGGFRASARTTAFDVPRKRSGSIASHAFEDDVTGDGVVDLVLATEHELRLHAGKASSKRGRGLVADRPLHTIPLPAVEPDPVEVVLDLSGSGRRLTSSQPARFLWTRDLDGDGVAESLLLRKTEEGAGVLIVVRRR